MIGEEWSHDFVWMLSIGRVGFSFGSKIVLYMLKRFAYCHCIKNWSRAHTHDQSVYDNSYMHKICKCNIINMSTCYSLPCALFDIGIAGHYC